MTQHDTPRTGRAMTMREIREALGHNTTEPTRPAWVDGDPLMEAIASAVWEQCAQHDSGLVVDDPRNIAAVAATVARAAAAPTTDRAAVTPPLDETHGLSVQHADALWDAVAIPGPRKPTFMEQYERVCRTVARILEELTPAEEPTTDRAAALREAADEAETRLEKRLRYSERRNDELRAECKRRGKKILDYSEKNRALEREIDGLQKQLGAEILRANHAEAELRRMADEAQSEATAEHHTVDGIRYLCYSGDHYCPPADEAQPAQPQTGEAQLEITEYFVQSQQPDGSWEQASSTTTELDFAVRRLIARRRMQPDLVCRLAQRTTKTTVRPLPDFPDAPQPPTRP
ncbi:hypothetical protein [Streptomyces griseosporeus]|uniref:hypothetical protein n=1 Tax=Streptomyces griseosporeus TaxID=1910 RepID=UPI0036FC6D4E